MHLDWKWIKQRPQYIAEELSKYYDVYVFYQYARKRELLTQNKTKGLKLIPWIGIPKRYDVPILWHLTKLYIRAFVKLFMLFTKPDFVWVGAPYLMDYIPKSTKFPIIHDSMDNFQWFYGPGTFMNGYISTPEKRALKESKIIFTSAHALAEVINNKYPCKEKTVLIRNAFGGNIIETAPDPVYTPQKDKLKIGFVGALGHSMDFKLMHKWLDEFPNLEINLIGPIDKYHSQWFRDRLNFLGAIDHNKLYDKVKDFHALMLPFRIDDSVLSRDCIKLYEYINFNKPIIAVRYPEIERFEDWVDFYNKNEEAVEIMRRYVENGPKRKYTAEQRIQFLNDNSWEARVKVIVKHLNDLTSE